MEKKTKIIIGVAAGLALAVGIYFGVTRMFKKKDEQSADEGSDAKSSDKQPVTHQASTPSKGSPGVNITRPASRGAAFEPKGSATTTTSSSPSAVTPEKANKAEKAGKKIWVYAKTDGVKAYKQSTTKGVNIGPLYNTFNKGKIIGYYTGTKSIGGEKWYAVLDGKNAILVNEKLIYTKTF